MPLQLSPELKQLLRMKKPAFVESMCENSTKKELVVLYKLLHYRNIDIDDAEQLIVDTFTKEELAESIYRIMHRKTFWCVATISNCVSLLINSKVWLNSFSRIRREQKSANPQKKKQLSLLGGALFVMHSLFVVSDLNSLYKRRNQTRRQKRINKMLLDMHLQKSLEPTRKNHKPVKGQPVKGKSVKSKSVKKPAKSKSVKKPAKKPAKKTRSK